jgi:adenine-specific DNA-methyltransferase
MALNYIGSKHSLLAFIDEVFEQVADGDERVFCDIFAGTGAVGRWFKRKGMSVIANDIQYYSYVMNRAYIGISEQPTFSGLAKRFKVSSEEAVFDSLNSLSGRSAFVTQHYSPEGGRQYYTVENASRIDAIRTSLDEWRAEGTITEDEFFYLLASLIEAADNIANTASVYGAFLKKFKARALRPITMRSLELSDSDSGTVYNEDANDLIRNIESDVLYLDPPYNHRQYGANYHVLETIAKYDSPKVKGVTGLRPYYRSKYCRPKDVICAFRDIVEHARTRHILVSYNDEGLASVQDVLDVLSLRGEPKTFEKPHIRYKADSAREYRRDGTVEYIHYVRVEK